MPTDRPAVESTVICVVPWPYSAVQLRTWPTSWGACPGQPWARMSSPRTQTSAAKPPHGSVSTNLRMVLSGPAPRSVTRLLLPKLMPDERRYVPASRNTTRSARHDAIALLICPAVTPGRSVAHTVVRVGMPPAIPWLPRLQSIARVRSRIPAQSCASATEGPMRRTTLSTHVRIAGCTPLGLRNRLEGGRTDDVAQPPRDMTNRLEAAVEENDRAQVQRREDDGDHHDAHQRRHRDGRPAERRESPDDHRGCGAGQRRGQHVLPDRVDDRGDAEARRPPRIPQRRNRENAEIRDPRRRDPEWAQQQEQQILADQSQVHTQSHADEREGRERAEQMPAASRGVSREATEGRHGHTCDRSRDFDRNREEVECLLVESERLRAKSPPDQEVVHVPHEVADREASVRVDREPQRRDRAVVAPWQPGDPSTPYPG